MSAPADAAGDAVVRALPESLTIYAVADLRTAMLGWIAALDPGAVALEVDASPVGELDAAGLQLLVSLRRALAERGLALALVDPSPVLTAGCATLGLDALLAGRDAEACA